MTITASPLCWPAEWPRSPAQYRVPGRFTVTEKTPGRRWYSREAITIATASRRVMEELRKMGVAQDGVILSTNLRVRQDNLPVANQAQPRDPGAAVYWPHGASHRCVAIDIYTRVEQNVAALAATLDAMRAIERHGGATVLERAFTGFTALPAPIVAGMARPWWEVLELPPPPSPGRDEIELAYRRLRSARHPDRGGSNEAFNEVERAYHEAMR